MQLYSIQKGRSYFLQGRCAIFYKLDNMLDAIDVRYGNVKNEL